MRKSAILALAVLLLAPARSEALIFDTVAGGMKYAKDAAYQAFVKLKWIEQIRIMKQNYDASQRYYREFKRLNEGKGLVHNVGEMFKAAGNQMAYELEAQVDRDFIHTYNTDTRVDRFFLSVDHKIASNMRYAGDQMAAMISNRQKGIDIAKEANGLSPKDAANLQAKAQGLQLQLLQQLHEDNLRLIELQSMRLAAEARREKRGHKLNEQLRKSVERRVPGAGREERR